MPGPNDSKTLSPEGLQFIKNVEEEGGRPRLHAYDDGTGTWTLSWGCTRGVKQGDTCTVDDAVRMLDRELAGHINEVHRLITVPISQGLFDAMVSFFFNCGAGKCQRLIAAVNSGSDDATRKAFMLYTKAYDAKTKQTVTWPGLVKRRSAELAHWAHMDDLDVTVPTPTAPRVPAPIADTEASAAVEALKSKSAWALVTGGGAVAADKVRSTFEALPEITADVQAQIDPLSSLAGLMKANISAILGVVTLVCIAVAIYRHAHDKKTIKELKGE